MAKQAYAELLKDPRWQRKRLEVLSRNDFTCEECCAKDQTLHVHHTFYEKNRKPWDYPTASLRALCEHCHEMAQTLMSRIQEASGRLSYGDQLDILGVAIGLQMSYATPERFTVDHNHMLYGIARVFGTNAGFVKNLMADDRTLSGDDIVKALTPLWFGAA